MRGLEASELAVIVGQDAIQIQFQTTGGNRHTLRATARLTAARAGVRPTHRRADCRTQASPGECSRAQPPHRSGSGQMQALMWYMASQPARQTERHGWGCPVRRPTSCRRACRRPAVARPTRAAKRPRRLGARRQ